MYSGEVAVEQDHLSKLLEAANILQIKGLYESHEDDQDESNDSKKVPENKNDQPTNQLPVNKVMANQNSALKGDMLIRNPNRVKRKSTASDTSHDDSKTLKKVKILYFNASFNCFRRFYFKDLPYSLVG